MRVAITGIAGFIGSNLASRLAPIHEVTGIDNFSTGYRENLNKSIRVTEGSILDQEKLLQALEGSDVIVHLAALPSVPRSIADPTATHRVNVEGTLKVLETARVVGMPHVIVASSSSVYGANPVLPKHEGLQPMPASPYAATKLATEQYALAWQASYGLPTLALRFFNVFGPRQRAGHAYAAVVPAFVTRALAGLPLEVYGDGHQTRDFTFVGSVCDAITDAIDRRVVSPNPVNLAFGSRLSLRDVAAAVGRFLGVTLELDHRPSRPGDVRDSQADPRLFKSLFPQVEAVPFEDGVRETIEWMRRYT